MSIDLNCYRVFIASPPGLGTERAAVLDEIDRYNKAEAMARGVLFVPAGMKASFSAFGREQTGPQILESDFFVLLLWDRWGSSPGSQAGAVEKSGTEEEYTVALECYRDPDRPMRQFAMMFKAVNQQQLSDTGPQLDRVLEFRKEIEGQKSHRADSFDTTRRCRSLMRWHLATWVQEQEQEQESGAKNTETTRPVKSPLILSPESVDETDKANAFENMERPYESLTAKAWGLADAGHLTEAEIEFAEIVTGHDQLETLVSYGIFLCGTGRLDQARTLMERAVQLAEDQGEGPSTANACSNLGVVLELLEDPDAAGKMYRKSLEAAQRLGQDPHIAKMKSLLEKLGGSISE